jgi:F-type H+-transporting ATPase subunit c
MNKAIKFAPVLASLFSVAAFAAEGGEAMGAGHWVAIGAAICMAMAALGGTTAQGRAAAAALEGMARNPQSQKQVFVPMLLGMALIESLVILGFVIALMLVGKV